jgi:hypothetical protein
MTRGFLVVLSVALTFTACTDDPVAPPPRDAATPPPDASPRIRRDDGVATLGFLVERAGSTLVLEQQAPELRPTSRGVAQHARQELAIGRGGDEIRVVTNASTAIYVKGTRVASLDAVPLRTPLLVAGTRRGNALSARLITDLSGAGPPKAEHRRMLDKLALEGTSSLPVAPSVKPSAPSAAVTSLCLGQNMDYVDANIHEFHGCWGGPSASDNWDVPDIPIFCPLVGCFVIDEVSSTFALGGWAFDWPFRFTASSPELTYHVPGDVSLGVTSLPALGTAFTFTGGLGFDYGLNIDFCHPTLEIPPRIVCDNLGTFHLSILSMIHQTTLAGPLKSSDRLEIAEVGCPSVGILVIPNVPFDPLALGLCEDLDLVGRPFAAKVTAEGASPPVTETHSFDGAARTLTVRPDAAQVNVSMSDFSWAPDMQMGFFFRLKSFGITLWDSPTISVTGGLWPAVSTPFPGTDFTVATDPESPIANPSYLFQPTVATLANLSVNPAPTQLLIVSSPTLAEGQPVRAELTESYDGSPIEGAELRFVATSPSGMQTTTVGTTNANGIAQAILPNGEYAIVVEFIGTQFYLSKAASQSPVYVYHPTTFVIWGGNAGGIVAGGRYNFWGSQWHKQVTGGAFNGDASFKGHAFSVSGTSWIGAPGNDVPPPPQIAEYIGVIVATEAALDGVNTVGNVAGRVILRVENAALFFPEPGSPAWGVMETQLSPAAFAVAAGG